MKEETNLWVEKAQEDLDDALYNFGGRRYGITAFLSQQAVEKILKAALVELEEKRPPKTHDLVYLSETCGLEIPEKWQSIFEEMTKSYFRVRYPDIGRRYFTKPEMAKKHLEFTKEFLPWVLEKLNR